MFQRRRAIRMWTGGPALEPLFRRRRPSAERAGDRELQDVVAPSATTAPGRNRSRRLRLQRASLVTRTTLRPGRASASPASVQDEQFSRCGSGTNGTSHATEAQPRVSAFSINSPCHGTVDGKATFTGRAMRTSFAGETAAQALKFGANALMTEPGVQSGNRHMVLYASLCLPENWEREERPGSVRAENRRLNGRGASRGFAARRRQRSSDQMRRITQHTGEPGAEVTMRCAPKYWQFVTENGWGDRQMFWFRPRRS